MLAQPLVEDTHQASRLPLLDAANDPIAAARTITSSLIILDNLDPVSPDVTSF